MAEQVAYEIHSHEFRVYRVERSPDGSLTAVCRALPIVGIDGKVYEGTLDEVRVPLSPTPDADDGD